MEELISKYLAGDPNAGWELVLSQKNLIMNLAGRVRLPSSVDYEDVVSEMLVQVHSDLPRYDPRYSLSTFVHTLFWNNIHQIIGNLKGSCGSIPLPDICVYPDDTEKSDDNELLFIAMDTLDKVSPLHKEVFLMWCREAAIEQIIDAANRHLGSDTFTKNTARNLVRDSVSAVRAALQKEIENLQ